MYLFSMICGADCASAAVGNAEGGSTLGAMAVEALLEIDIVVVTLAMIQLRGFVTSRG
jgi:hypothetical protein